MSPERHIALLICGLCLGTAALAEEEPVVGAEPAPEAELLEYLGMWEETDEEWLLHDDALTADNRERSDPAPEGEESTEKDDES